MGVSFSYWTTDKVTADVKAKVEAEAIGVAQKHIWWGEGLHFFDWPGKEGRLAGDTKVYLSSRETASGEALEADPEEYEFMAYYDCRFIIRHLQRWSAAYAITWELLLAGETIGTISRGQPSPALAKWLQEIAETVGAMGDEGDDQRARGILARYGY